MQSSFRPEDVAAAAAALGRSEVVGIPTETYYALAVSAFDPLALERLLVLKGRTAAQTLSLLIEPGMLGQLVAQVPPLAEHLMAEHWPGPLTLALPARADLPAALVQHGCVAVRVSPHPLARAIVAQVGTPVTATSANRSGEPPLACAADVRRVFPSLLVVGAGSTPGGQPSTIARVTDAGIEILRQGALKIV